MDPPDQDGERRALPEGGQEPTGSAEPGFLFACPRCGERLPEFVEVCPRCGEDLAGDFSTTYRVPMSPLARRIALVALIGLVLLVLLVVVGLVSQMLAGGPRPPGP